MQYTLSVGFCPADWYVPLARAAEAAGWDSIAVPDGLFYYEKTSAPYPYSADGSRFWAADTPFLDPWVVIATMAGATERIRFYPSVLKLAVRDPLLVAKELSSCAVLTGERVGLGVGLSPWPEDFEVLREGEQTVARQFGAAPADVVLQRTGQIDPLGTVPSRWVATPTSASVE